MVGSGGVSGNRGAILPLSLRDILGRRRWTGRIHGRSAESDRCAIRYTQTRRRTRGTAFLDDPDRSSVYHGCDCRSSFEAVPCPSRNSPLEVRFPPQAAPVPNATASDGDFRGTPSAPSPSDSQFLAPPQKPDELGRLAHFRVLKQLGAGDDRGDRIALDGMPLSRSESQRDAPAGSPSSSAIMP